MINENRVILMTHLQCYENKEGRDSGKIADYFRGDYIGRQMLLTLITTTIAVVMIAVAYILYDFENFMKTIYQVDLVSFAKHWAVVYLIFVSIACIITYIIYAIRYSKAKKSLRRYYNTLRKLTKMYGEES